MLLSWRESVNMSGLWVDGIYDVPGFCLGGRLRGRFPAVIYIVGKSVIGPDTHATRHLSRCAPLPVINPVMTASMIISTFDGRCWRHEAVKPFHAAYFICMSFLMWQSSLFSLNYITLWVIIRFWPAGIKNMIMKFAATQELTTFALLEIYCRVNENN